MLTPQQINDARIKLGLAPIAGSGISTPALTGTSLLDKLQNKKTLTEKLQADGSFPAKVGLEQVGGVNKIKSSIEAGARDIQAGMTKGGISGVPDVLLGMAKAGFGTISGVAQAVFSPVTPILKPVAEAVTPVLRQQNPDLAKAYDLAIQKLDNFATTNPEGATLVGDVANTLLLAIGGKTDLPALGDIKTGVNFVAKDVVGGVKSAIDSPSKLLSDIRSGIAKSNVEPNLTTSVDRLHAQPAPVGVGVVKEDPLTTYNNYLAQEAKLKLDAKQSDSLGLVGSKDLAPAIDSVIKQRQVAGATMGSEMKTLGNTKVNVTDVFPKFEQTLTDNGVQFTGKKFTASPTSKLTTQDISLINDYVKKLNTLGATPSAGELDAFLSRTPKELDVYKAKNNIMGTTNGERMIQGNLKDLSAGLSPEKNPAFQAYADAKTKYAELSQFLNDNKTFFGKKTASGDFIKDASTLKSAVRSTLNSGKKDFLVKLETLTGKPLIDKTVLALQAMKDAGNAQGESLLNMLMQKDGLNIPTTKAGIIDRLATGAINKGKKILAGTPAEQTQRFISNRMALPEVTKIAEKMSAGTGLEEIVANVKAGSGGTLNLDGTVKTLANDHIVSVRSLNVPTSQVTKDGILNFVKDNADVIKTFGDQVKIGTFDLGGGTSSIDINLALKDPKIAMKLAKAGQQQSVFNEAMATKTNFGDKSFTQTGFDGKTPKSLSIAEIQKTLSGSKPILKGKGETLSNYTPEQVTNIQDTLIHNENKAVVISSDTIKEMHPQYDVNNPAPLHEDSSIIAKDTFIKAIDKDTSGLAKFVAGASGSGKTEAVIKGMENTPSVIYDSVMQNPETASKLIDYALSKGKKVEIHPVYTPPELSTLFNQKRARTVADAVSESSIGKFRNSMNVLYEKYNSQVDFKPVVNSQLGSKPVEITTDIGKFIKDQVLPDKVIQEKVNFIKDYIGIFGIDKTMKDINNLLGI